MISIAHFIYDNEHNPWLGGGGFVRTRELYKRFPDRFKVTLFCGNFHGAANYTLSNNLRVVYIGKPVGNYLLSRLLYMRYAYKLLKKASGEYHLIVEDFSPFSPLFSYRFVPAAKVLCSFQNHFGMVHCLKKFGPLGIFPALIEKKYPDHFANIVFCSKDLESATMKHRTLPPPFSAVIPNGVFSEMLLTKQPLQSKKHLLFAGRLELYQKGIDILLKQFFLFRQKNGGLPLILAGSGKDLKRIESIIRSLGIAEQVVLTGKLTHDALKKAYEEALVTIVPSRYESWGMVSIESQACGTPVIAADIPGLRQTVTHGKTGFLFQTPEQINQYVHVLLSDTFLYNKMCVNAVEFASQFTWEKQALQAIDFITPLIAASRKTGTITY